MVVLGGDGGAASGPCWLLVLHRSEASRLLPVVLQHVVWRRGCQHCIWIAGRLGQQHAWPLLKALRLQGLSELPDQPMLLALQLLELDPEGFGLTLIVCFALQKLCALLEFQLLIL